MTEWWQYLLYAVVIAIVGGAVGYGFTWLGVLREQKRRETNAVRSILAEVEAAIRLAGEPWVGKIVPFESGIWDANKGSVLGLPADAQDALMQVYIEIHKANALFQLNIRLPHGRGSYDGDYRKQCSKIAEEGKNARDKVEKSLGEKGMKKEGEHAS